MGQGYIDPIIYNEENNALLRQADDYRAEIEMLNKNISGDASHLQAATALLHFAGKPLTASSSSPGASLSSS